VPPAVTKVLLRVLAGWRRAELVWRSQHQNVVELIGLFSLAPYVGAMRWQTCVLGITDFLPRG